MKDIHQKIIVIVGPTASGKSDLAIALARKYDGEIISADSRQVYRGMDVGTGKVTRDNMVPPPLSKGRVGRGLKNSLQTSPQSPPWKGGEEKYFFSEGIRHHLLDVASPKRSYNVAHFVRDAKKAIENIEKRGKLPIVCGGTTFWIEALLFGTQLPEVKPDPTLRKRLGKLSAKKLFSMLEKKDPARAASIDPHNKIRLIRALEIIETFGKVPPLRHPVLSLRHPERNEGSRGNKDGDMNIDIPRQARNDNAIIIALNPPKEILHQRIAKRLEKRLKEGMLEEVERLHEEGISWKRLESFGLEYRYIALFLQGKVSREEMKERLETEIRQYAKRQITFLRRLEKMGAEIRWIADLKEADKL